MNISKFLLLAPLVLLAGCFPPTMVDEATKMANSTTRVEENWGRLSENQSVSFTTVATVSKLGDTGLGTVLVRRSVDQQIFVAVTAERGLSIGTKVCMTDVTFKRVITQIGQDGFTFAKPC
jgi:hypothetical protein